MKTNKLIKNQYIFYGISVLTVFILIVVLLGRYLSTNSVDNQDSRSARSLQTPIFVPTPAVVEVAVSRDEKTSEPEISLNTSSKNIVGLTWGNFEARVGRCFQGEECKFLDSPSSLYKQFKETNNTNANDSLIAFLRSRMSDVVFRDRYKNILKRMIDDFYSPEELPFQNAAYYNYIGDFNKSLELYLDLERKVAAGGVFRPAPKLNIANTFYDLKRFKEALTYYHASLSEHEDPAMIRFIERRIKDIQNQLRL